jgi:hypothetical protein
MVLSSILSSIHHHHFININIAHYIIENNLSNSYNLYGNILLFNIIYLILSIQKKNGELYLFNFPFINNTQLQILTILSKYYKNIKIYKYNTYNHRYICCIHATEFIGISKDELENIYHQYFSFYQENIHSHIDNIFSGKRVDNLYLDNILSNPIDKKIKNDLTLFNKKFHTFVLNDLKTKIDIHEFINHKSTTNKQKEYILDKLFKKQIEIFNDFYQNIYIKKIKNKI